MTTLCPDLDGSTALLTELAADLHGDPRYTEPDAPAPRLIARYLDTTETIMRRAAVDDADPTSE